MTQIFVLNSAFGLMNAVAGIDAGAVPDAGGSRILLAVNAAAVPETTRSITEIGHLQPLLRRFDRIESINDLVAPTLPTSWDPDVESLPMLERLLRTVWGIPAGPVELYLQSPQVAPSRTLAAIFRAASVTIVADGLMTYAPLRVRLPESILSRMTDVVYADIVPGVRPMVLAERRRPGTPIAPERVARVLSEVAAANADDRLDRIARTSSRTVVILGQYLAALGLMSRERELALQMEMIDRALQWQPARIVFKPHPSAPPSQTDLLAARAHAHSLDWVVYDGDAPAEILAQLLGAVGVVAGFSTALPTVQAVFGIPVASVGASDLLRRLDPYENSNRMPVVIADAMSNPPRRASTAELVETVAYTMQPRALAHLRPAAEQTLGRLTADERDRWFGRRRLTELRLPGGHRPVSGWEPTGDATISRLEQARLVWRGLRRRVARALRELKGR